MKQVHKSRLRFIVIVLVSLAIAMALVLYGLRKNINLYVTPAELIAGEANTSTHFRLGGLVSKGSVQRNNNSLEITFNVTDLMHTVPVHYKGILPDLFSEGKGIVVDGHLAPDGSFVATQVLAKHDSNYRPPGIKNEMNDTKKPQSLVNIQSRMQKDAT